MQTLDEKPEAATASLGTQPRPKVALAIGTTLGDKYLLENELGRGGHGVVFGAKNLATGGSVAIKMLSAPSPDAAARMLREAQLAAKIASEHVAKVHDVAMHDGSPYVVMDHLLGETLSARLKREKTMSPANAVALLVQVCRGLAPFHAKGIVHRDLKPSNLFLVKRSDGTDLVAILDFGVAKEAEETDSGALTATNAVLGSPFYMAPEQVRSARDVDARADIWSLGVTLYELLSGKTPFAAATTPGTLAAVIADTPAPLDGPLGAVARRCLEKDPAQRYANVDELARALEASLTKKSRAPYVAVAVLAVAVAFGATRRGPADPKPVVAAPIPSATPVIVAEQPPPPTPPEPPAPSSAATVARVAIAPPRPTPSAAASIVRARPDVKSETADRK